MTCHNFLQMESLHESYNSIDVQTHRGCLKWIRVPGRTAFDLMPSSSETIGNFANQYVITNYQKKMQKKRDRARAVRKRRKVEPSPTNLLLNEQNHEQSRSSRSRKSNNKSSRKSKH